MKIFLGSLVLPIKERKMKELSFGLAINQHHSGNNNGKQPAAEHEAQHPARERREPVVSQPEHWWDAGAQCPGSVPESCCPAVQSGSRWAQGDAVPTLLPAVFSRAEYRRGGVKELGLVGTLNANTSLLCARPGLTRLRAPHQPGPRFISSSPALPQYQSKHRCTPKQMAGAGGTCGFIFQLLLCTCSVSSGSGEKILLRF